MKISYDLAALPERRRAMKESEEVTAIKAFLAGKQKNNSSGGEYRWMKTAGA